MKAGVNGNLGTATARADGIVGAGNRVRLFANPVDAAFAPLIPAARFVSRVLLVVSVLRFFMAGLPSGPRARLLCS
jgi:hypothetical protein